MRKVCLSAPNAPPAVGPYSQAVAAGGMIYVSGQGPFAPDGGGPRLGTFEHEARLTLENLKSLVEDLGASLQDVVRVTIYLSDMERFSELNAMYSEYFQDHYPARTCIEAKRLPLNIQVEMDAILVDPSVKTAATESRSGS